MAQTIEAFVGQSLDDAKISPLHIKVISLIAAGYFFDVIDYIVQGSLFPDAGGCLPIAAVAVTQLGPEQKQKSLDEIAPPTG